MPSEDDTTQPTQNDHDHKPACCKANNAGDQAHLPIGHANNPAIEIPPENYYVEDEIEPLLEAQPFEDQHHETSTWWQYVFGWLARLIARNKKVAKQARDNTSHIVNHEQRSVGHAWRIRRLEQAVFPDEDAELAGGAAEQ